jgi:hypothetical protein
VSARFCSEHAEITTGADPASAKAYLPPSWLPLPGALAEEEAAAARAAAQAKREAEWCSNQGSLQALTAAWVRGPGVWGGGQGRAAS